MDMFAKEKKDFLSKKDKSKKGSIDKDIISLVNEINSNDDYYTTSSCAGRIVLLEMKSRKKNECNWVFTKHDKVKLDEINKALDGYSINEKSNHSKNKNEKFNKMKSNIKIINPKNIKSYEIWLKQQPLILHVACRNMDAAKRFLDISRRLFKKAGIIGLTERKVTVEIIGSEHLETIVKDGNFAVAEEYLEELIKYANRNFMENKKKISQFLKLIREL